MLKTDIIDKNKILLPPQEILEIKFQQATTAQVQFDSVN